MKNPGRSVAHRSCKRSGPAWRSRRGATLVEVAVAMLLFAVGVLGAQASATVAFRQARDAHVRQHVAALAGSELERLANGPCKGESAGSIMLRGVRIEGSTGGSLGPHARAAEQTVRYLAAQRSVVDTFRTAVRCR